MADPSGKCFLLCAAVGAAVGAVASVVSYAAPIVVSNVISGNGLTEGLDLGEAARAGLNGAVVGAVSGATFGVVSYAALGQVAAWNSAEGLAIGTLSGAVGSLTNLGWKKATGQPITPADAFATFGNMLPFPGWKTQIGFGPVVDQVANGLANLIAKSQVLHP